MISVFRNNAVTSAVVFGAVGALLLFGNIRYHHKKRQHISITSDKVTESIRIVGISDLHLGYTISAKELSKWVRMINAENPDMVIIGGDIVDNHLRPVTRDSIESVFRQLKAPMGVYSCAGNHDHMFALKEDAAFYKRAGIELLRDTSITVNGITIIGRDDLSNPDRKRMDRVMENINGATFTILLDHQPRKLEKAAEHKIDFQFSGHTHRGQIFPATLIADALFELSHGYMKKGDTHFYVSSGIGIWGGKFRIGSRSEYLVVELNPSD